MKDNASYMKFAVTREVGWRERIVVSLKMGAVIIILIILSEALGVGWLFGSENSGKANDWVLDSGSFLFSLVTLLPFAALLEEFLFRFIPYKISKLFHNRFYWFFGITSSLVFAWFHSLEGLKEFSGLATPQLIVGLVLWRYIPSGFKNVFWIHLLFNVFIGLFVQALVLLSS